MASLAIGYVMIQRNGVGRTDVELDPYIPPVYNTWDTIAENLTNPVFDNHYENKRFIPGIGVYALPFASVQMGPGMSHTQVYRTSDMVI